MFVALADDDFMHLRTTFVIYLFLMEKRKERDGIVVKLTLVWSFYNNWKMMIVIYFTPAVIDYFFIESILAKFYIIIQVSAKILMNLQISSDFTTFVYKSC